MTLVSASPRAVAPAAPRARLRAARGSRSRRAALAPPSASSGAGPSGRDDDDLESSRSSYASSSGAVKGLVSGLTSLVNALGSAGSAPSPGDARSTRRERRDARALPATPRDPPALALCIAEEFTEKKYLWTGDIEPEMYDLFCTFTDPTLSFVGLETFETNLRNLQPFLTALVRDADVELFACELDEPSRRVRASWRMTGNLALPWRPRIDLRGRTTFTYYDAGVERGCLIEAYDEEWEIGAGEAVAQLARPWKW